MVNLENLVLEKITYEEWRKKVLELTNELYSAFKTQLKVVTEFEKVWPFLDLITLTGKENVILEELGSLLDYTESLANNINLLSNKDDAIAKFDFYVDGTGRYWTIKKGEYEKVIEEKEKRERMNEKLYL